MAKTPHAKAIMRHATPVAAQHGHERFVAEHVVDTPAVRVGE